MRVFKEVSTLQNHLKTSIVNSIQGRVREIILDVAQKHINKNVYQVYTPSGEGAYDRTYELLEAVTVGNIVIGTKFITFEIFMDVEKINPVVNDGSKWNAHASVDPIDVSEYIPMWVEEGTTGSLWDRQPAHYMKDTTSELKFGRLARELSVALSNEGWTVTMVG